LVVRQFRVPCAHAPALLPLPIDPDLSPRSAAEELGFTFLPCVLVGLSRAPQIVTNKSLSNDIWSPQVNAVIIPADACGGSAVLSFSQSNTKIITVSENRTRMQVPPEAVGIKAIAVNSYLEALGVIVCDRAGIDPAALSASISSLHQLSNIERTNS
jgi:hypothetical protein